MKMIRILLVMTLAGMSSLLNAQQESVVLTLEQACEYALQHNKSLLNARDNVASSKEKVRETLAQGLPQVEVRPDEIQRGGPSYTWQTIEALQGEFPAAELFLLLGQDAYEMFPHWHRGERILELCRILVFPRSGAGTFSPDLRGGRVEVVELNLPELSSTQIRSWNHKPALAREFLPPQVFEIWRSHWEHFHEI